MVGICHGIGKFVADIWLACTWQNVCGKMRNGIGGFCRRTRRLFNLSESPFLRACPRESVGMISVAEHASLHKKKNRNQESLRADTVQKII